MTVRLLAMAGCLMLVPLALHADPTPSLDDLVTRNIEAKGGANALHAIKTMVKRGKLLVNDGQFELIYAETIRNPGSVRVEATLQGLTQIEAYDGSQGWKINPFQGRKDPERMSADDAKELAEMAIDYEGPLVDWKEKGYKLDYLGREDIDGTLAYKLRLVRPNGDSEYVYLDPDHYLEIRLVSKRREHGVEVEFESDLGEYEKVGGVFFPFSVETGKKGDSDKQKFVLAKVEVNNAVNDAQFAFPAAASH